MPSENNLLIDLLVDLPKRITNERVVLEVGHSFLLWCDLRHTKVVPLTKYLWNIWPGVRKRRPFLCYSIDQLMHGIRLGITESDASPKDVVKHLSKSLLSTYLHYASLSGLLRPGNQRRGFQSMLLRSPFVQSDTSELMKSILDPADITETIYTDVWSKI